MLTRENALSRLKLLPKTTLGDIAMVIETAETQGEYSGGCVDGGSIWMDDTSETLYCLANEIRELANKQGRPNHDHNQPNQRRNQSFAFH